MFRSWYVLILFITSLAIFLGCSEPDIIHPDNFKLTGKPPAWGLETTDGERVLEEEYLFLKQALNKDLYIHFENKTIVKHVLERSTTNMASDDFVRTVSAINYLEFKNFSYMLLIKYVFYLLSRKMISLKAMFEKFKVGVKAVKTYKKLMKRA